MGLGPQAWSGGLCHLHSADSDPALRTRWGRMQLLGQCRLTAGAGPCKLCLLRSPLSSAREPHTRLFLPNRLGSVMTVLLEDPPHPGSCDNLLQPQTWTLSALRTAVNSEPRHPAKQDPVAKETPWEQREGTPHSLEGTWGHHRTGVLRHKISLWMLVLASAPLVTRSTWTGMSPVSRETSPTGKTTGPWQQASDFTSQWCPAKGGGEWGVESVSCPH